MAPRDLCKARVTAFSGSRHDVIDQRLAAPSMTLDQWTETNRKSRSAFEGGVVLGKDRRASWKM